MAALRTVQDLVRQLGARGSHIAILNVADDGATTQLTDADLGDRALRLATGLVDSGIRPGEMVLIFGPNSPDWIIVRLALAAMGAIAVAIDDLSTDAELAVLIPHSGARYLFAASAHVPRLAALDQAETRRIYRLDEAGGDVPHWSDLLAAQAGELPTVAPDDDAMLVYTSGTTGKPKSFLLSHGNLMANVNGLCAEALVGPKDRALLPLPLHHVYPLTVGCLTALACGTTIVLPSAVTGPQLVAALKAGRVTVIVGVPRLYAALVAGIEARVAAQGAMARHAFRILLRLSVALRRRGFRVGRALFGRLHRQIAPDLWLMASGGAKFEAELIWTLEGLGWAVLSGYGLAETASILTANRRGHARIGSEGTPLPGAEIRIAEPDPDGVGEIQTRGPSVFTGYRDNPEATAAAFTPDGWFRTGDLGRVDDDGYVYIAGRVKEMIVLGGGKNIFPEEIEKVYAESPYIREIAVLDQNGALVALVVPDLEAIATTGNRRIGDVIRVALADRSRELASFQRVAGFAITREALPRTRLGKYQRFLLPELYRRAKSGTPAAAPLELTAEDRALLAQSPAREIWDWLKARYPDKTLALDLSPQLDLGIDSLEWVTLTLELAERFGVQLTEQDAADAATLRDLVRRAASRAGERTTREASTRTLTAAQRSWIEPAGPGARLLGLGLYAVDALLMRTAFGLKVLGRERVPTRGPYIVACNHLSDLDPPILAAALGYKRLTTLWWSGDSARIFGHAPGRVLARAAHVFPVDERAPATTLAYAEAVLSRDESLLWFPESWRSPDGELQEFRSGIGHLLGRVDVPVVPARIVGTFEAMPRGRTVPRFAPVQVAFGAPVTREQLVKQGSGDTDPVRIARALRAIVAALPATRQ